MMGKLRHFADSIRERVVSLVAFAQNLASKVSRRHLEQHHLRRRASLSHHLPPHLELARYRSSDPRLSFKISLLHLMEPPEADHPAGGIPLRYLRPSITVIRGTAHLLPPWLALRTRTNLLSWSLLILKCLLQQVVQFSTHMHPLHPRQQTRVEVGYLVNVSGTTRPVMLESTGTPKEEPRLPCLRTPKGGLLIVLHQSASPPHDTNLHDTKNIRSSGLLVVRPSIPI
jgi:hypothetical protein